MKHNPSEVRKKYFTCPEFYSTGHTTFWPIHNLFVVLTNVILSDIQSFEDRYRDNEDTGHYSVLSARNELFAIRLSQKLSLSSRTSSLSKAFTSGLLHTAGGLISSLDVNYRGIIEEVDNTMWTYHQKFTVTMDLSNYGRKDPAFSEIMHDLSKLIPETKLFQGFYKVDAPKIWENPQNRPFIEWNFYLKPADYMITN